MNVRRVIPAVNTHPTTRPQSCRYCGHWRRGVPWVRHDTLSKSLRDHRQTQVTVERYRCTNCGCTFRHHPDGVTARAQSQCSVVLTALLYGLGLSCHPAAHVLGALGIELSAKTVWHDAQVAGEALRTIRPSGRVRVLGVDETS